MEGFFLFSYTNETSVKYWCLTIKKERQYHSMNDTESLGPSPCVALYDSNLLFMVNVCVL